jgi:hypothetical protein
MVNIHLRHFFNLKPTITYAKLYKKNYNEKIGFLLGIKKTIKKDFLKVLFAILKLSS